MEKNEISVWDVLSSIDCNKYTEKKNGLTYLSWAWAWGIVKKNFKRVSYRVITFDGRPYLYDEALGYLVMTEVTIEGETLQMQLPVMDASNKAMKNKPYEYETRFGKRRVDAASMFDVNTAIMRCLTKNLAMFGLGHYIYAGEDLPEKQENSEAAMQKHWSALVSKCGSMDELVCLWDTVPEDQKKIVKIIFESRKKLIKQ